MDGILVHHELVLMSETIQISRVFLIRVEQLTAVAQQVLAHSQRLSEVSFELLDFSVDFGQLIERFVKHCTLLLPFDRQCGLDGFLISAQLLFKEIKISQHQRLVVKRLLLLARRWHVESTCLFAALYMGNLMDVLYIYADFRAPTLYLQFGTLLLHSA